MRCAGLARSASLLRKMPNGCGNGCGSRTTSTSGLRQWREGWRRISPASAKGGKGAALPPQRAALHRSRAARMGAVRGQRPRYRMARARDASAALDGTGISVERGRLHEAWRGARAGAGSSACRGRACVDRCGIYARAARSGWNCRCRREERGRFMNVLSGFADISFWQLVPVAAVALVCLDRRWRVRLWHRRADAAGAGADGWRRAGRADHRHLGAVHQFQPRLCVSRNMPTGAAPRSCSRVACRPACSARGATRCLSSTGAALVIGGMLIAERAVAAAHAHHGFKARRARAWARLGRLWRGGGRHGRLRRDPAVAADGGGRRRARVSSRPMRRYPLSSAS